MKARRACTYRELKLPPIPTMKQYLAERDARYVSLVTDRVVIQTGRARMAYIGVGIFCNDFKRFFVHRFFENLLPFIIKN